MIPNVLANRYASTAMREIWSPEAKIVAERRLCLAVLQAQADLDVEFGGDDPETVIAEYRRLYPAMRPDQLLIAATTAGRSWRGAVIELEERARAGAPAFAYQQDFAVPVADGRSGAPHGSDIAFVFDTLSATRATGPAAERMVELFGGAFTAFARTGNPNLPGLPPWAPYSLERRETMLMDVAPRLENDPRGGERRLFARVPYLQPGT